MSGASSSSGSLEGAEALKPVKEGLMGKRLSHRVRPTTPIPKGRSYEEEEEEEESEEDPHSTRPRSCLEPGDQATYQR